MNQTLLRKYIDEALAGKRDHRFTSVIQQIHCMSRARVYALLNAIVSAMDPGEIYFEVGTYQGGSLISALLGNESRAVAVDSFHEFTQSNSRERTLDNLEKFGVGNRVVLHNARYQDYFQALPADYKIAVYNYDGEHGFEPQLAGMEVAWKHLQPGSLIIVDDYSYVEVWLAVNQFICNHIKNIKILLVIDALNPTNGPEDTWWNGVVILRVV